jgi:hypothetical protein
MICTVKFVNKQLSVDVREEFINISKFFYGSCNTIGEAAFIRAHAVKTLDWTSSGTGIKGKNIVFRKRLAVNPC